MGKQLREERAEYNTGSDTHEVRHRNPVKELGFAAMEHALTLDTDLSDGAYRTYALLKFYWQHKDSAFPTVDTMAAKRGVRRETIGVHLKELVDKKLITRKPRVGTSTMTYLEDLPQEYQEIALTELERRDARREENLTARDTPLGKSNARREENLTQSTTNKEVHTLPKSEEPEQPTPRETAWKELTEVFPMTNGVAWQKFDELWRQFPDPRRHAYAIARARKANPAKLQFYLEDFCNYDPDKPKTWGEGKPAARAYQSPRYQRLEPVSRLRVRTD